MYRKSIYITILTMALSVSTLALAGGSESPFSKSGKKSYIVIMANDPVVAYKGDIAGFEATRPARGEKIKPNNKVRNYEGFLKRRHNDSLAGARVATTAKVHQYTFALNGYSAILTEAEAEVLKGQPGVVKVLEDRMRYKHTDSSPAFLGLTAKGGAYAKGYTGQGVVVGIIDTGIWPEHPSFADDGSYGVPPTGPLPCDFGNTDHNPNDAPFACNNKLIGARQMLATYRFYYGADSDEFDSARDDDGHGTHTASTTAGNARVRAYMYGMPLETISGIAPRAHIVAYKALGNQEGFTSDLAAAIDQAVADGVDVINYSIGSGAIAAGPEADEIAFLFAADAGVFAATSAGNDGPGAATIGSPSTMPWVTSVGASTQSRFFEGKVMLGNGRTYTGASITPELGWRPLVDAADAGDDLCTPTSLGGGLNSSVVTGKVVLCRRGVIGRADKSEAVHEAGGVGMIMYNNDNTDNLFTDTHWVPSVHIDNTPGVAIKKYIATAFNPRAKFMTDEIDRWQSAPSMAIFSSRGPNPVAPDIIKPDVTAPGLQILAGGSPFPNPDSTPPGELFQAIAGTSMSSPHVAGVFALLKQAHPDWSPAMAKSALMTTAYQDVRDNDRVSKADPFDMGAGHIRPGGKWTKGSITEPGLVYDAGLREYEAFSCGMDWGVFAPGSSCAALDSMGVPSKPYNLNLPSIGISAVAGKQTVTRTVTSVALGGGRVTYKAKVKAPPGYTVSVSPSTIRLASGESATFFVTVTKVSAPIDEWRFGSLTWISDNYSVYSPIAVKASLFNAPAEVAGSGVSGSASFPVSFGYTGSYTAAPHGLVPATVTRATVQQDPNQTFDPNDGFSKVHQFTLSGAAFFRIAMPPKAADANADLDIYVYDPSNALAAFSTNVGTDELIDITSPVNGIWKVYVHGWEAPVDGAIYDLRTWAISATPGGNLTIGSVPTSARIGNTGTVNVSWTGATAGQWHLGAVSHTGNAGSMGLTLINVDNR